MTTYLSREDLSKLRPSWRELTAIIEKALFALNQGDYAQPVKPYLRYHNPINRIIAMPAFIGGKFNFAGIKWIASFPENLKKGCPRAHSITILNEFDSGKPLAILSSSELSGLRTAAVSSFVITRFIDQLSNQKLRVGITGFGPIGQLHAEMVSEILDERLDKIFIYDVNTQLKHTQKNNKYAFVNSWQEAFIDSDIFISCTCTNEPYIDLLPKNNSLQLNVSLRDYLPEVVMKSSCIFVDDWDEVCRENTDIEKASIEFGLCETNTISIKHLIHKDKIREIEMKGYLKNGFLSFHFMGMAVFDIAVSSYFYEKAIEEKIGILLPS